MTMNLRKENPKILGWIGRLYRRAVGGAAGIRSNLN